MYKLLVSNKHKYDLGTIFMFMYLLFPFKFNFLLPIQTLLYYFFCILGNVYFLYKCRNAKLDKNLRFCVFVFVFLYVLMFIISIAVPFFMETGDYSYSSNLITYTIKIVFFSNVAFLCENENDFLNLYIRSTSLYVCFSLFFLVPPVRSIAKSLLFNPSKSDGTFSEILYYTRYGLQGFSGFEHTFKCSLGFLFGLYLLSQKEKCSIYVFLNLIGCCLYGRVGIVACCAIFGYFYFYQSIICKKYKLFIAGIIIVIIFVVTFILLIDVLADNPVTRWMFEPFINLVKKGEFSSESSTGLKTMYRLPDLESLWYGDGKYFEDGHYYKHTDVGFLRPIYFWGIFGTILYYFITLEIILSLSLVIRNKNSNFLFFGIILLLLCYELKGEANLSVIVILFNFLFVVFSKDKNQQSLFRNCRKYILEI